MSALADKLNAICKRKVTKTARAIDCRMSDQDIIRFAVLENRMVITMDKDFGELVYHSGMEHGGILLLRLEDATCSEKVQAMAEILAKYSIQIPHKFCLRISKWRAKN